MENKTIDARGLACPLPVVNAKKASDEMTDDGILTVLVDNEIAVQNLTKFGTGRGYPTSSEKKGEKEYSVVFQISANGAVSESSENNAVHHCCKFQSKRTGCRSLSQYYGRRRGKAGEDFNEILYFRPYQAGSASRNHSLLQLRSISHL